MVFTDINSPSIRLSGRWNVKEKEAVSATPGAYFEFAYKGKCAELYFDIFWNIAPFPHLWISVDDGAMIEASLDKYIRVDAKCDGEHIVKVIFKSAVESQHRWYNPLNGQVTFLGFDADAPTELPEDNRKIMEVIGDSITEGVLTDPTYGPTIFDLPSRLYENDITATYGWQTAEKLGFRPFMVGYSGLAMSAVGCGAVPPPETSYYNYYENAPVKEFTADVIIINHGANDRWTEEGAYIREYIKFLGTLRKHNPNAKIVVLSPFVGAFIEELDEMVTKFNDENNDEIIFISTNHWIPEEPLHPARDGHTIVTERLVAELKKVLGKEVLR